MRKELLFFLSCFLSAFLFLPGCQKQPSLLFGSTYLDDNTGANIVLVDTTSVNVSTVFVDSTSTAATGYLMVGSYNDDYLGNVTSRAYLQVIPPPSLPSLDPRIDTYDSIGMIMFFPTGNPYYGDTTQYQHYMVNRIDTLFQLGSFQYGWFSNYSLPLGPTLGETSVRIEPNRPTNFAANTSQGTGDTVRIRMDDNLGRSLYNMIYDKSDSIVKSDQWMNWFHGLCISPDVTNYPVANIISGFKDSCLMRIYYRENAEISSEKYIDFTLTNKSNQYNNLIFNRSGKAIAGIDTATQARQTPPATRSDSIGHVGYVYTIGGMNVKLTFPYLSSIALRRDYVGLLRAQLTVRPVPGSFSQTWRLPPAVGIYYTDQNNLLGTPIPAAGTAGAQSGNLVLDYFNPLTTAYTYDVTAFVASQLTNPSPAAAQTGLMLSIPPPNDVAAFNRLILADQSYPITQRITLSVYYISLYPHL
ncbi:MAG TPA: DUF4270 family protein [Puia sp.]|nr:DUF4270 family protein [Puia sp.]